MSQVHVKPDEFADLVMLFLLESIRDDNLLGGNEQFREFVHKIDQRGLKNELMKQYLSMNGEQRLRYRKLKPVFEGGSSVKINILQDKSLSGKDTTVVDKVIDYAKKSIGVKNEEFDRELCKRVFRKVKEVRFKTSKPITEERLDKIIDYCINEQEEQQNG